MSKKNFPWDKKDWKPTCRQDSIDILFAIRLGHISPKDASDILFPEFKPNYGG